jgi:hypothetical protein
LRHSALKNVKWTIALIVGICALCALFSSCSLNSFQTAGGTTTETTNGVTASIRKSDGSAAAGATVRLRRSDYVAQPPASLAKSTIYSADVLTDAQGHFEINGIDRGAYTIEVSDQPKGSGQGGAILLTCSIDINDTLDLGADTLQPFATVQGAADTTGTSGKNLFVQVVGIEQLTPVNSTGGFVISNLPAGLFSLRVIAVQGAQTTVIRTDQVSAISGDTVRVTMPGWSFAKKLFLNTTPTGADVKSDVYEFPLLVRLNSSNFDFTQVGDSGRDMRFSKKDGTALPYEIELWDAANNKAAIWVKVDTVHRNDNSQFVIMYWGLRSTVGSTGSATVSLSNGAAVFDTAKGFQGVWHLNEGSGQAAKDATANRFDGTPSDTAPTAASGAIGLAQEFDGKSNYLQMLGTAGSKLNFPENGYYSVSAWVFVDTLVDSTTHVIASKGHQQYFLKLYWGDGQHWEFTEYHDKVGWQVSPYSPAKARTWKFLVGVRDGNNQYLYLDGELVNNAYGVAVDSSARNTADDFSIGKYLRYAAYAGQGFCWFDGKIDEVRVSSKSLSADWIKLCYMNQKEPDALLKW